MADTSDEIRELVQVACEAISDVRIREAVENHLIDPKLQLRTWEYGENATAPVWLIADTKELGA